MKRWIAFVVAVISAACGPAADGLHDLVILGGRVMDPETGLDGVRHVGIRNGEIVRLTERAILGRDTIDASGLVVAPGFIDLHAHGQDSVSNRLRRWTASRQPSSSRSACSR